MLKIIFYSLLFSLPLHTLFAQPGYLGSLNSVEFKATGSPTLYSASKVDLSDSTQLTNSRRLAFTSYQLTYGRVISKTIELSLGYRFSNMTLIATPSNLLRQDSLGNSMDPKRFLDDPKVLSHGLEFAFKYYRKGSFAPIGKFVGFSVSLQTASIKEGESLLIGSRGPLVTGKSGFFKSTYDINELINYELQNTTSVSAFSLKGLIGRNYPVTNRILISGYLSFPLLSYFGSSTESMVGIFLDQPVNVLDESFFRTIAFTMKKYNRLAGEIGVKYSF